MKAIAYTTQKKHYDRNHLIYKSVSLKNLQKRQQTVTNLIRKLLQHCFPAFTFYLLPNP